VRLSALTRAQNRAADAAKLMADARQMYEGNLQKDPARAAWVPVLQYEHALAIKESGKIPEARAIFEGIVKQFANTPEAANAQWRVGQCQREELVGALTAARAILDRPGAKAEEVQAAKVMVAEGPKAIAKTAEALQAQADDLGKKAAGSEAHLHALYELAWCCRTLADGEVEAARAKLQQEAVDKAREKLAKETPAGQTAPTPHPPDLPLSAIPLQPAEKAAQDNYARLIAAAPESALANQVRLELSELQAQRGNDLPALGLLAEAMEKNPAPDIAERIRLRAAAIFLAKNDPKAAWPHVEVVLKNAGSPFVGEARYLAGEAFIQQKDWPKAIEQLVVFRDRGEFHNIPGISDRALLRFGYALAQANQWDQCRGTLEQLVGRFGQSPWVEEARFGMGFALQTLKQFDPAVNQYGEVTRRTVSLFAAKAQLQIGLCRLEQKNFPEAAKSLLVVPFTYDYPELNAQAFCQAGQAYLEQKQPAEAAKLWQRVVKDYPNTEWAKVAQQGLAGIK
jgi:TolA-binding protein